MAFGDYGSERGLDIGIGCAACHCLNGSGDTGGGTVRQDTDDIAFGAFVFRGDGHHAGGFGGRYGQVGLGSNCSIDGFADGGSAVAGRYGHH